MILGIVTFAVAQVAGGGLGYVLGGMAGAAIGFPAAGMLWVLVDRVQALRVINWLRRDGGRTLPIRRGQWGEIASRVSRLLRNREQLNAESQARLHEFLEAIRESPNGVVLLDAQGHIEWCNQTAARHFAFDAERDLMQLIGNLVRDPAFAAHYASRAPAREIVIQGPDSSPSRPVRLAVQLHPYGAGRRMLLSRDVTMVEQAETMRRDFVANVSHEIRTPLTVLAGFIETLQNLPLEAADRARYLEMMATQSQRMQTLVNDLLTLSRLEGSPPPGTRDWVRVQPLLAQCETDGRALSRLLAVPPHDLQVDPAPDVEIAGIQAELLSAMFNLLSNAVRYTPPGRTIRVRWTVLTDGRHEYAVQDNGPGIAPEHLPRLTERFYRVDRSRSRETGGTGLGLAIVKHVVQRHGGELRIDSTPGRGSTFSMVFPTSRVRPVLAAAA